MLAKSPNMDLAGGVWDPKSPIVQKSTKMQCPSIRMITSSAGCKMKVMVEIWLSEEILKKILDSEIAGLNTLELVASIY